MRITGLLLWEIDIDIPDPNVGNVSGSLLVYSEGDQVVLALEGRLVDQLKLLVIGLEGALDLFQIKDEHKGLFDGSEVELRVDENRLAGVEIDQLVAVRVILHVLDFFDIEEREFLQLLVWPLLLHALTKCDISLC